jgi:hypothetical protein
MKGIVLATAFTLLLIPAYCQQPAIINRFKLLITNSKKEILLVKWKGNWEVPGAAYGDSTEIKPINAFLDDLAKEFGLSPNEKKLAGIFTYYMNDRKYPMIFSYYSLKVNQDKLNITGDIEDAKWASPKEALKTISYANSIAIIQKIQSSPKILWGGSFRLYPSQGWKYETIEDFYKLN